MKNGAGPFAYQTNYPTLASWYVNAASSRACVGNPTAGSVGAAKALLDAERSITRQGGHDPPQGQHQGWGLGWEDDAAAMINCGDVENEASPLHLAAAISHKEMVSCCFGFAAHPPSRPTPPFSSPAEGKEGLCPKAVGRLVRPPAGNKGLRQTSFFGCLLTAVGGFYAVSSSSLLCLSPPVGHRLAPSLPPLFRCHRFLRATWQVLPHPTAVPL